MSHAVPPPSRPEYALVGAEVGLIYGLATALPAWAWFKVFPLIPIAAFTAAGFILGYLIFDRSSAS